MYDGNYCYSTNDLSDIVNYAKSKGWLVMDQGYIVVIQRKIIKRDTKLIMKNEYREE